MADPLTLKSCKPCKGGIAPLTAQQAEDFHREVPEWDLRDAAHRIERKFKFKNFGEAAGAFRAGWGISRSGRVRAFDIKSLDPAQAAESL